MSARVRTVPCPYCDGKSPCDSCEGRGYIRVSAPPKPRVLGARAWEADQEEAAKEYAAFCRSHKLSVRTYRRTVRAGRAGVPVIIVVAYQKQEAGGAR